MFSCLHILSSFLWFVLISFLNVTLLILHMRIVDRLACLGAPRPMGLGVIGIDADEVEGRNVLELDAPKIGEFAAEDEMKKLLLWRLCSHVLPRISITERWRPGSAAA